MTSFSLDATKKEVYMPVPPQFKKNTIKRRLKKKNPGFTGTQKAIAEKIKK